ncbi:hypothetical protein FQA47_022530 [Oryzias melastigma]|uniref:Uncharacterized protein n=1 Tax=Oryzias melastigma TaxID=30732 RepID=A0A834CJI6_ORYME|nr:hypothetical protein FQA47_022530 [Oryzias melastigma]
MTRAHQQSNQKVRVMNNEKKNLHSKSVVQKYTEERRDWLYLISALEVKRFISESLEDSKRQMSAHTKVRVKSIPLLNAAHTYGTLEYGTLSLQLLWFTFTWFL